MDRWNDTTGAEDDTTETEENEACPGCGREPGEGVDPECEHPDGCGYWKEIYE